jgi:hypothetical protein
MEKNIVEILQQKFPGVTGSSMTEKLSNDLDRYSKKTDIPETQDIIETIRERLFKLETHDRVIERMEKSKYRPSELLIAIKAWVEIFGDNGTFHNASTKEKQSPVKFIKEHLRKKLGIKETRKLNRISTIVSYREK